MSNSFRISPTSLIEGIHESPSQGENKAKLGPSPIRQEKSPIDHKIMQ